MWNILQKILLILNIVDYVQKKKKENNEEISNRDEKTGK